MVVCTYASTGRQIEALRISAIEKQLGNLPTVYKSTIHIKHLAFHKAISFT